MQIQRIFIIGHRTDVRFTHCCIASIRRWYPDHRITLIKDELAGAYDTSELEKCFGVDLFQCAVTRFGLGVARLEPLFLTPAERCLIIDSDIVFAGPVLQRLDAFDEDFVVEGVNHTAEETKQHYFDADQLSFHIPDFQRPEFVFNVGQIVATTGLLTREMFEPLVDFSEPRRLLRQDLFFHEQGVLNFVLLRMAQRGEITIGRDRFMKWAGILRPEDVTIERIENGPEYDFMVHWAGVKSAVLKHNALPELLIYFEKCYYKALGQCKRSRNSPAAGI